ncbi:Rrf2 family transcriptional regulator [Azospirillum sp. TSO22-1]|uniref:Rrf2 family transcriptional regulator n=1 Tax=Azospirillum sp. TSO22-1 TaxID=716789 RepID=UPI000D6153A8|nr:Rrf2 family transcriptional regulator [Azospirillum sp. TSO22-1]PWC41183.1 transcriptional regulator [Azospirillum sp. TSO22-1]
MRLQKATRFALYAILDLASDPEKQFSAAEIAERYGISVNHLSKVLRSLGRAGLVEAVRGAGGGYRFSGNAKRLTLLDLILLFEDIDSAPGAGREPGDATPEGQALGGVLEEIEDIARATLSSISVATMLKLIAEERRKGGTDPRAAADGPSTAPAASAGR